MNTVRAHVMRFVRIDELLENVAGSDEIANMVIDEFLVHAEPQVEEIASALGGADLALVASKAHRFKGSLAAVSATNATESAGLLERAALRGDLEAAKSEFSALCVHVEDVVKALLMWRDEARGGSGCHG